MLEGGPELQVDIALPAVIVPAREVRRLVPFLPLPPRMLPLGPESAPLLEAVVWVE